MSCGIVRCNSKDDFDRLCIKVGRGQGDGDIGTRLWGLGGLGDSRRGTMERGDAWNGDVGT